LRLREECASVTVREEEYRRLLGLPRGRSLEGRVAELAAWAADWYARHGRPWRVAREVASLKLEAETVRVEGVAFTSTTLAERLSRAGARGAVIAGVGAGSEAELEARRLWDAGRPDEYFFLEIYASAVVEQLVTELGALLCAWADAREQAVLPHYSPGYPGWELADQPALLELLLAGGEPLPSALEVLWSGQLRPKQSLLGLFGVAPKSERVASLQEHIPCAACSFAPCGFRRAPYRPAEYHVARDVLTSPAAQRIWKALEGTPGGTAE
jgi:hypothetical protein